MAARLLYDDGNQTQSSPREGELAKGREK